MPETTEKPEPQPVSENKQNYAERREQQKRLRKLEKEVKASESKIEEMEQRLKQLDATLCTPEGASDMQLVSEYTSTKRALDDEVTRWEQLAELLEEMQQP